MSYSHPHLCAALEILAAYLSVVVEQGQKNRPLTQDEIQMPGTEVCMNCGSRLLLPAGKVESVGL